MGGVTATTDDRGSWLPPDRPLTVADLEGAPNDGHRYELLDGMLLVSPAPGRWHQTLVTEIATSLNLAAPAGVEVFVAPFAVRPDGPYTELQPDVLVAASDDLTDRGLPAAPLLAVEVLSPSTSLVDLNLKRAAYQRMGTPSYWVLDPNVPDLLVLELDADGRYAEVAHVTGEQAYTATRPFPVTLSPAALRRRQR